MKVFRHIGITLLAMALLVSCGDEEPVVPEISVPVEEENYFSNGISFNENKAEKEITFTTNTDWNISVAQTSRNSLEWCTVFPLSGKAGTNKIKIKTEENETYDDRSVTITINLGTVEKTIIVTQKQKDALIISSKREEIDAKGGQIGIEVDSNVDYKTIIPGECNWITWAQESRALTKKNLLFNIAESEEVDQREGKIIIQSGELADTVYVYQTGQKILHLKENKYDVGDKGDTICVEITSNFNYGVRMPQLDWIDEIQESRVASTKLLYYHVKPNETYDNREADIVFFDEDGDLLDTLHIVQYQKDALILGQKEFKVSAKGEDIQVNLLHNVDYEVDIKDDWITRCESRALTESSLVFTVKPNESFEARTGKIILTSKDKTLTETIVINQDEKGYATISKHRFEVEAEGKIIEVEVSTNVDLLVTTNQSWVGQVKSKSSENMDKQTLYFKVNPNNSYEDRKAEIELYNEAEGISERIEVYQAQKHALIVGQKGFYVGADGEVIHVNVSYNVGYEVEVKDTWITQVSSRGLSTDRLSFAIASNEITEGRTGKIVISNKDKTMSEIITVTQSARGYLNVSQSKYEVGPGGETIKIEVFTNVDFSTQIGADWVHSNDAQTSRIDGKTVLYFKVDANGTYDDRATSIKLYNNEVGISETVTVTQHGKAKDDGDAGGTAPDIPWGN